MGPRTALVAHLAAGKVWYVPTNSHQTHSKLTIFQIVTSASEIVVPYHRSLDMHIELVNNLRSHSISFDDSRRAVLKWAEQPWILDSGWDGKLGDICDIEIERWDTPR